MKIKKVNRYYCEFCKKSGCSAYHIQKHEKSCTSNPNRKCKMCEAMGNENHDLNLLKKLLPSPSDYGLIYAWSYDGENGTSVSPDFKTTLMKSMNKLEYEAENCPICILSALKQKNIPCWLAEFKYVDKLKSVWIDINNSQRESSL